MPRKKSSGQQKSSEEDPVVNVACEWGECQSEFQLKNYSEFRAHVEGHIRQILPGYRNQRSRDPIPDDFVCCWKECGWDSPEDTDELVRHILFHAFHTRLKAFGTQKQLTLKLSKCILDSTGRNLVPDIPEPFLCEWEECNLEFNCPYLYYQHVESHVMAVDKSTPEEPGSNKSVTCHWNGCTSKVRNHHKLKEHCHTHTREKVYACSVCGGMFASMSKYTDHLSRQNTSEFQTFQCSHCLKYCGSERILRDHMRHHVNNIKCEFCDMTCPNQSALKQHIKFRHSTDRPYECDVCDYSCKTYSDLRRHRESHNAVFSYRCAVEGCKFSARAMQTLKRHFRVQHEGAALAKYECHLCGSRYTRGTGLTHHLKLKHKFRWPAGHPRFRYKEHEDGIWRLQTVRFESFKLSQQLNEKESLEDAQMAESDVDDDDYEEYGEDDMSSDHDDGEVDIEGNSDGLEEEAEICSHGKQQDGHNSTRVKDSYQDLLRQYEQHERQLIRKSTGGEEVSSADANQSGPARNDRQSVRKHPYQRPESPASNLDIPHTLLALQEAAMRLASRQDKQTI